MNVVSYETDVHVKFSVKNDLVVVFVNAYDLINDITLEQLIRSIVEDCILRLIYTHK